MTRARLIAMASLRWCFEQTPLFRFGTILAYDEVYRRRVTESL